MSKSQTKVEPQVTESDAQAVKTLSKDIPGMTKETRRQKKDDNSATTQTETQKNKSQKRRKVKKANLKKSKTKKSAGKKESIRKTRTKKSKGKKTPSGQPDISSAREDAEPDTNAVANNLDPEEPDKEPDTVDRNTDDELKQEQPAVEEIPAEAANEAKVEEQALAGQATDEPAEPEDAPQDPNTDANNMTENQTTETKTSDNSEMGEVSEAIKKLTQSSEVLPDKSQPAENLTQSLNGNLFKMCANEIMQNQLTWANPEDSLQQAFAKMQQTDAGYIMIGLNGALEGIVSKSDITRAMSPYLMPIFAKWRRPLDDATLKIRIKWIMSRPVRTIKPETSLAAIMEHMSQFRGRCLPVTDEQGNVQGLVTVFDIFEALLKSGSNTPAESRRAGALAESAAPAGTT